MKTLTWMVVIGAFVMLGACDSLNSSSNESRPYFVEAGESAPEDHFAKVKPVLEHYCLKCHRAEGDNYKRNGNLRFETEELALKGGNSQKPAYIKATQENPEAWKKSVSWERINLDRFHPLAMPPERTHPGGMRKEHKVIFENWLKAGAPWPKDQKLKFDLIDRKTILPTKLFKKLGFDKKKVQETDDLKAYEEKIPGSTITFHMQPIQGGTFEMGSPETDANKREEELPRHKVKVDAFYMAKFETTWQQYYLWQFDKEVASREADPSYQVREADLISDMVSRPTPPYHGMSFGMAVEDHPAICMTQLSAKVFCMWLSAKTGKFYRLPTEAEWEYACRAGSTTIYPFGNEATDLEKYAWFDDNNKEPFHYHAVGGKLPNAFGLHDMLGNVSEWVLDPYAEDTYKKRAEKLVDNPVTFSDKVYPRVVRGGSWEDYAEDLRPASRLASHKNWKMKDPQIPQSVWYHTEAKWVGFRVVCDPTPPKLEDLHKYWPTDQEIKDIPIK